ncbi:hypothetical protein ACFVVM_07345 [Nocardia sp. NPDC058176]|uniref:hypothetical protein n=1 Tax=Nocardia sp. NPDC058176 TaxID=3346368 RepID=UPI0036DF89ED
MLGTVGSAADLRYLTGRMLQLLHAGDGDMPAMELVYSKLHRAGWRSWPQAEAINVVLDALWVDVLTNAVSRESIDSVLCVLGTMEPTIASRLDEFGDPAGSRRLHEFAVYHCRVENGLLIPGNAYWDRVSPTYDELTTWLNDGSALDAVTTAFDRVDDPELLELIAETHSVLTRFG